MRENELLEGLLELIMSVKIALVSKIEIGTTEIKFDKLLVEEAVNVSKDLTVSGNVVITGNHMVLITNHLDINEYEYL